MLMENFGFQHYFIAFSWYLNVFVSGDVIKCSLPDNSVPSFRWKDGVPHFLDKSYNECDLPVNNSNSTIQHQARPSGFNNSTFQYVKSSREHKAVFVVCSFYEEPITYMVRRMFGQNGDPTQSWHSGHQSSEHIISEMGRYFSATTPSIVIADIKSSDKSAIEKVDAVVLGSFLWDLKHWHSSWCRQAANNGNLTDSLHIALCKHVQLGNTSVHRVTSDSAQPLDVETIIQSWGRMTLPWCDAATLQKWQETYLTEVHALLDAFPHSVLFLRTQPISSAVFLANEHCHGPMNAFIVEVWATLQHLVHQSASGATLGRRVRLIATHELFQAPNENGVDHFSDDNIHLTEDGFKVYRGYVMRVLDEYRRSQFRK
eukprot:gene30202-39407_t